MKKAQWYFDFISPFSYLQFNKVLGWRERLDITPVPILFGGVLQHHGQLGPAEIKGKREFTYRFVRWQAEQEGVTLRFPPAHPFNPVAALRLCIAAGTTWQSIETIFAHIWRDGRAATVDDLGEIGRALGVMDVAAATGTDAVKAQLRANTDGAIAAGLFGVPTLICGDEIFWGNDATPMIEDWFAHPARFDEPEYRRIEQLPYGIERRR
jgi:2-hydroxychromene-2-carboxylate isomerase